MKFYFSFFVLYLLIPCIIISQTTLDELPDIPDGFINQIQNLKPAFLKLQRNNFNHLLKEYSAQDLIIGQTDPNEIITISGPYFLDGNLFIFNNGQLILDNADFQIDGKITLVNNGKLVATDGSFTVIQDFIYEHGTLLLNSSEFHFDGVSFSSSGQSWGMAVTDSSNYILENCEITDGFITTSMTENANAAIYNTITPGEFICFENNTIQFNNCNFVLMWLLLPDLSVVDISLPDDSLLIGWQFENGNPGVSGIPYSISIDSCINVNWGLISMSGSNGTFRDTDFRTSGLYFSEPEVITVSNITNNSNYVDEMINVPDRILRMVNTHVTTWNLYPASRSNISVRNCIFGELLAFDTSNVLIENSICDGTGGYLGAINNSFVIVIGSFITSQVIAREYGFLIAGYSAFNSTEIAAAENAIMGILNTSTWVEPSANDAAIIFDAQLPPVEGSVNSQIGVEGTARIITGPLSTVEFQGYSVSYTEDVQNPFWEPTDGFHSNEVTDDTLALWNTNGLDPGQYGLLLTIYHSLGDSLPLTSSARLETGTTDISDNGNNFSEYSFELEQNFPNPFNPSTKIIYTIPIASNPLLGGARGEYISLKVYDVLGHEIVTLTDEYKTPGKHEVEFNNDDLPSGIYFYRLHAGNFIQTKKMIILK